MLFRRIFGFSRFGGFITTQSKKRNFNLYIKGRKNVTQDGYLYITVRTHPRINKNLSMRHIEDIW